jgi:hypothetical protein
MRAALLLAASLALASCAGITEQAVYSVSSGSGESPEFGVSALSAGPMPANYAAFNRIDEHVNDFHAQQFCTLGYDKLEQGTMPYDPGTLAWWRVRCVPYELGFWPDDFTF